MGDNDKKTADSTQSAAGRLEYLKDKKAPGTTSDNLTPKGAGDAAEFVGIVEYLRDPPVFRYCSLGLYNPSKELIGSSHVETLGGIIASLYGSDCLQKITYEPPKGIDESRTERGLCPRKYHPLSVLERSKFENAVLDALKGKK